MAHAQVDQQVAAISTRAVADNERSSAAQDFARLVAEYERQSRVENARYEIRLVASTARADSQAFETATERATIAHVAFRRALEDVYRDPDRARSAFIAMAQKRGVTHATEEMRDNPEQFGKLVSLDRPILFGLLHSADDRAARTAAIPASEQGRNAILAEGRLREVMVDVRARRLGNEHVQGIRTVVQFEQALASIYHEPAAARQAFEATAQQYSPDRAATYFLDQPWRYGTLRGTLDDPSLRGLDGSRPQPEAQSQAATLGADAIRAMRTLPEAEVRIAREMNTMPLVTAERVMADTFAERAEQRERDLASQIARLPGTNLLEQRIRRALESLTPGEFQQVYQSLSAPRRAVVAKLKEVTKEVLLGPEVMER